MGQTMTSSTAIVYRINNFTVHTVCTHTHTHRGIVVIWCSLFVYAISAAPAHIHNLEWLRWWALMYSLVTHSVCGPRPRTEHNQIEIIWCLKIDRNILKYFILIFHTNILAVSMRFYLIFSSSLLSCCAVECMGERSPIDARVGVYCLFIFFFAHIHSLNSETENFRYNISWFVVRARFMVSVCVSTVLWHVTMWFYAEYKRREVAGRTNDLRARRRQFMFGAS